MFSKDFSAVTSNFVSRIRIRAEHSSRYWLYALAASYSTRRTQRSVRQTTGIQNLDQHSFFDELFPVPPVDDQRVIAGYLDRETAKIDTLIEEQQRLIETLRERRQAVIDRRVDSDQSSRRMALKFALSDVDQGVSPQAEAGLADEPGSWGVLKSGCVNRGVFRQREHKRLPAGYDVTALEPVGVGDVIVSRASGSPDLVGSCAMVEHLDFNLILSDKLFRLRPSPGTDPRFLVWLLNGRRYRHKVRQAISGAEGLANNLPLRALLRFEVNLPYVDEQRRIADYLDEQTSKIDILIGETERFIELSRERRAALITETVTGQIDVLDRASEGAP